MSNNEHQDFLESVQEGMGVLGFWNEASKSMLIASMERVYLPHIIREWCITDLVINGDRALLKWQKRLMPLTNEEMKDRYS